MRKKLLALTFFVIIAVCFHSCDFKIPEEVEIRVSPEISTSVNGDLSNMLLDMIKDATKDNEDINVYQYTGYKPDGKNEVMTFLLQYNVLKGQTLDFFDSFQNVLDDFRNIDLEDIQDMAEPIDLSKLSDFSDGNEMMMEVNLHDIIAEAEGALSSQIEWDTILPIILGLGVDSYPDFFITKDPIKIKGFDSITFANGIFSIDMEFTPNVTGIPPTYNLDGVDFEIKSIQIKDSHNTIIPGTLADLVTKTIRFNDGENGKDGKFEQKVYFNLAGVTLANSFDILINDFEDHSPRGVPKNVNLEIHTGEIETPPGKPNAPIIRGVTGYENDPIEFELEEQEIELAYEGSEFIHAQIETGTMSFKFNMQRTEKQDATWMNIYDDSSGTAVDLDLGQTIYIKQGVSAPDPNGNYWPGLCNYTAKVDVSTGVGSDFIPAPWKYDGTNGDLVDRHINLEEIMILGSGGYVSKVVIPEGKMSFMLNDADMESKVIQVEIEPDIKIQKLSYVHINPGDIFNFPDIEISIDEAAQYLKEIQFFDENGKDNKVGIEIKFGAVDIKGLSIMICEPNLGINYPAKDPQTIKAYESVAFTRNNFIFPIQEVEPDAENNRNLCFEVKITHSGSGDVMEMTGISLDDGELNFEVEDYQVFFVDSWTEATLDLSTMDVPMSGSFPEEGDDPINLAEMLEILEGFKIDGIKSYLYFDGPDRFFNLDPKITFEAKNGDKNNYELFEDGDFHLEKHPIPELDKGDGKFSGELKKGIPIKFDEILDNPPEDLQITYDIDLDGIKVTPEFLNGETGETLNVSIIVVLPMSLNAGDDGAKIQIPNMFNDEDAFGRESQGDDGPYLGYINSLTLNVEFNDSIFTGGTLFMKREGEEDGKEKLSFNLKGKTLSIPIKGELLDTIRDTYPYSIVEMGIRFEPKTGIKIPAKLEIKRIEFDADITIGFKF